MNKLLALLIVISSVTCLHGDEPAGQKNQRYQAPAPNLRGHYAADRAPDAQETRHSDFTTQLQRVVTAFISGKYQDVTFTYSKGHITLTGTVPSQEDKEALEALFRGIYGIKGVDNQLTVK